ncbi:MAG: hypothetical protein R3B70_22655 [Polyangiaceae bacterium]
MRAWKLGAVCLTLAALVVAGRPAVGQAPAGEECRRRCQEAKDERDAICRGLPSRKAREKCWRTSNEQYASCVKNCEPGPL